VKLRHENAFLEFEKLPDDARVRAPVVQALYGISASTLWRRVRDEASSIPRPKRDHGITSWRVGDLRRNLGTSTATK
jgi:predicted DNA-binding transcriptional regulator AlpA